VKSFKLEFCKHYVMIKQIRVKFATIMQTKDILDYIHTYVCEPTRNAFLGGKYWFVAFVDDYFRMSWVYTIHYKHEVLKIFQN
jgi:hypothetical protein